MIFILPLLEEGVTLIVFCYILGVSLESVLMHKERIITYVSSQLKVHEKNYLSHDLKQVMMVLILNLQRHYLYMMHCEIFIDHHNLKYIFFSMKFELEVEQVIEIIEGL